MNKQKITNSLFSGNRLSLSGFNNLAVAIGFLLFYGVSLYAADPVISNIVKTDVVNKPLTQKKIDAIIGTDIEGSEIGRNYYRNSMLINLVNTPKEIQEKVMKEYNTQKKDRSKLMNYFMEHKLKNLMEVIEEF
jgi:nucleoid DNA-binding protein